MLLGLVWVVSAWAGSPVIASPIRKIFIREVGTIPFRLPNGSRVDLSADLKKMFQTEIAQTPDLAPSEGFELDDCNPRIEIEANLTTIELNLKEFGIKIGYNPQGGFGNLLDSVSAEYNAKIGLVAFDFAIWQCTTKGCTALAASTVKNKTVSSATSVQINFGLVGSGATFLHSTEMGSLIRSMMRKGLSELRAQAHFPDLEWHAEILEINGKQALMNAGLIDRLKLNDRLVIYSPLMEESSLNQKMLCPAYYPLGYAHITKIDPLSSEISIDQVFGAGLFSLPIEKGNWVLIRR